MMVNIDELLSNLEEKYKGNVGLDRTTTLDTFRMMQGNQQVIDYIKNYKESLVAKTAKAKVVDSGYQSPVAKLRGRKK